MTERTARQVLDTTDWTSLHHAYDAASDAPGQLVQLLSGDAQACGDTLAYLDAAILHQGSIYPVTAPAARFVAAILDDERVGIACESALPWDERSRPLRAALLEWLGSVAESATWNDGEEDEFGDADEGASVQACRSVLPELYAATAPFLDDTDPAVRGAAVGAVSHLLVADELAKFRTEQATRLIRAAELAPARERAAVALTLGKWGLRPEPLLTDDDPSVKACAAIAPAYDGDLVGLAEVRSALSDPIRADSWFPEPVPQLDGRFRFALVATLLRRTSTFQEVLSEALAVARMTNAYTVGRDWGPLLERAFPRGYDARRPLTDAQRAFLATIVDNDECWDSVANPLLWLHKHDLPQKREDLRKLTN